LDTQYLQACLKAIKVKNMVNADVEVVNKSPLRMIGKGRQGAVFQVNQNICVKVFGNEEDCAREYYALSLGQKSSLFPNVYSKGPLYITMDIVQGIDVREYLQSQPLTKELSAKLIEMLITFKEIGFQRIDHHKRQIYIQPDGNLKVIDVARTVWRDRVYPYPRKLLTSLGEENKAIFLAHVKELAPELYQEWQHYIEMEKQSRQIYQNVLSQYKSAGKEALKKQTQKLLTRTSDASYVASLEGLMQKVFKEEWVKTMLAMGKDPDTIMGKIDEYWDQREQEGHFEKDKDHKKKDKDKDKKNKDERERHQKWNKVNKYERGRQRGRRR